MRVEFRARRVDPDPVESGSKISILSGPGPEIFLLPGSGPGPGLTNFNQPGPDPDPKILDPTGSSGGPKHIVDNA
jgi:hypothetical protein